jgi:hypothetical protein
MKNFLLTIVLSLITVLAFAQADVCNVTFETGDRVAAFSNSQNVNISFDYSVEEPGGTRIFARPFSNGSLTPGYGASGSPLYSGSGTANVFYNISSGAGLVDEIRFQIFNADQSELLKEFWVPVDFHYGQIGINNFTFSHDKDLASLLLDENFNITFDYKIDVPGGVRIFIRPMTHGSLTPGYGASGSPIFEGSGSKTVFFKINSGKNVHVDALRVAVVNPDQSQELMTFYVPVNLYFSTVKIDNIVASGGNFPLNGADRTISYNYQTTEAAGVRIFPRPWTNGGLTPNYAACGSNVYTGSGSNSCNFTINSTNQRVDHIRFKVVNPDQSEVLLEFLSPVEYTFGDFLIEDIELCPPAPVRLIPGEMVNLNYGYYNDEGVGTRIFARPFSQGSLSSGYSASGSPEYSGGSGLADDFFTINNENVIVDQIRFMVTNSDQSETLAEYFIPVHYEFRSDVVNSVAEPKEIPDVVEKMQVYPNPATTQVEINFRLKGTSDVILSFKDASGKVIFTQNREKAPAGMDQLLSVDFADYNLAPGLYFVELNGDGFKETKKLVVVR